MAEQGVVDTFDFGLGTFILPQPENKTEYVKIPRLSRTIPFGYVVDSEDDGWLQPVALELDALEKAKKYLKQYSSRQVSAWLTSVTGREISHVGLLKRIKNEQSHKRKSSTYRKLAEGYEKALKKAQEYEERTGTKDGSFFNSDRYVKLRESFAGDAT
jgi:hypothetical protein